MSEEAHVADETTEKTARTINAEIGKFHSFSPCPQRKPSSHNPSGLIPTFGAHV
jgi:hypothetical protein